ncbi:MAG: hypothetical protein E7653_05185 [Ruminococcaceae bacterium]|nr:hypothetical protein [Oscillospiraceae bacterium]
MNTDKGGGLFAAANTASGFVSYFDEIFFSEGIERRYIIKGGPGTGKSSFMRRVAESARTSGHSVELYYCSSDTNSLDGVIIDGRLAIFDGTAPHSYDTVLPGARDELIDLGAFWDSEMLSEKRETLSAYAAQKKAAYSNAYGYLCAAGEIDATLRQVTDDCVMRDKMNSAVERFCLKSFRDSAEQARLFHTQTEAFGIHGSVHLSTLSDAAFRRYAVVDFYGIAQQYMQRLVDRALACGQNICVSQDVVSGIANEIFFPDTGDYVYITAGESNADKETTRINMKRFADIGKLAEVRRYYRAARQAYRTLLDLASWQLAQAGRAHANMERIYVASMDFGSLRSYTDALIKRII